MIRSIALAAAMTASACAPVLPATANGISGTVTAVSDGDTMHIGTITVRVLGINTPETHDPHKRNPDGSYVVECGGPEATAFAKQMLLGKRVQLVKDNTQSDVDIYKRRLRYIKVDGVDYSIAVARAGWARSYVFNNHPVQEYSMIEAAQKEAQDAHRGIWGPLCPATN